MNQQRSLIRLSWIVFVHAGLVSLESVAIEWLTVGAGIPSLPLTAISVTIAGAVFMAVVTLWLKTGRLFIRVFQNSWKGVVAGSGLISIGLITWYDAVSRIGASKESLLAGPLETVVIVFLARVVLGERLQAKQAAGIALALAGFFAVVGSGGISSSTGVAFSTGDAEAVLSALSFGSGVIIITRLTGQHTPLAVTPVLLLFSGLILLAALPFVSYGKLAPQHFLFIAAFSTIPLAAGFTYVVGLARIGASLTSTIASFSIVIILAAQIASRLAGYTPILPDNLALAASGGILAVAGIYLVHRGETPSANRVSRHPV